jgi:hypothetical protein
MTSIFKRSPAAAEPNALAELVDVLKLIEKQLGVLANATSANLVRMMDFDLRHDPRFSDPRRLLASAAQVCSQHGQDGMIAEIFRRIGEGGRVFAEIGVGDGHENNTAFLLAQGWSGFWLDGDASFAATLDSRPELAAGRVKGMVGYLTRENVGEAFKQLGVPQEPDLLSIDVDQNTYYLWEGLGAYRPRVVVVEYNSTIPPQVDWKVRYDPQRVWDRTNNFGASLLALERLGTRLGYSLVGCDFIGADAFFVRSDLVADRFAAPFTAENHYERPRFQFAHRRGHPGSMLDSR